MRIQRERLLRLVTNEIDRLQAEEDLRAGREQARVEQRLEVYLRETLPHWRTFANRIRRAVSNGEPVTLEHAPPELRSLHSERLYWWSGSRDTEAREVAGDLRTLRRVLELAEDEYVTTTALERQGFSLGRALRDAR